jgi:Ras-related protein Rab-1A
MFNFYTKNNSGLENCDYILKICVAGDSGNGKTSIINKFTINEFIHAMPSTIGVDFKTKSIIVNKKKIKLQIWDTAGQERFKSVVSCYFRNIDGIILTYDTTNYDSFIHLINWINDIEKVVNLENISMLIVGTKIDLEHNRKVPLEEIINFVREHNFKYLETSSKDGTNIDALFNTFAEFILSKNKNINENKIKPIKTQRINKKNCCNN